MVAAISAKKNPACPGDFELLGRKAEALGQRFLDLADADTEAYKRIMKTVKTSDAQDALKDAVLTPHAILGASLEGLALAKDLGDRYYASTASDVGLAAQSLQAASDGAELTALMNLACITDRDFRTRYVTESRAMREQALRLSREVYQGVLNRLTPPRLRRFHKRHAKRL
jgi:formiminotetrahydrofolate cyclodeaminase